MAKTPPPAKPNNTAAAAGKEPASNGGSRLVRFRNDFYAQGFTLVAKIAMIEAVVIAVLLIVLGFAVSAASSVEVKYLAVTPDMRVVELPTTDQPYLGNAQVQKWVGEAIVQSFDWSYRNFRERFSAMETRFTRDGYLKWLQSMDKESQRVAYVRNNDLIVSFTPQSIVLLGEGPFRGSHRWRFEVNGNLVYSASGRADRTDKLKIIVDVDRVDVRYNGTGIAIAQMVESPA